MPRAILVLLATILWVSAALMAQTPTMIREVAKLQRTVTEGGRTVSEFDYKGVSVFGEVSLKDYSDATTAVRLQLERREKIVAVYASQQAVGWDTFGDLAVMTCAGSCNRPRGGGGRIFVFARIGDMLRLERTTVWMG